MVSSQDIHHGRILIVDDESANVALLAMMLRRAGYTAVDSTMDSSKVCDLHRANHYDLILLDLQMPGLDGFQVMERLKEFELGSYLPVLVIAAQPAHKLRALNAGARDFISKPFDLAEVLVRVHNLLEVRLLHEASRTYSHALESLARQDPLTGLANRRLAHERMQLALAHGRVTNSAMAVLYLDLDGFKRVNDEWGHGVGDELLKRVGERLVAMVRREDTVARLGGDEFLIVLWYVVSESAAAMVAKKAIEAVAQPYEIEGHAMRVTASAGIALYPAEGQGVDSEALMREADGALLEAKHAGKNAYSIARRTR